MGWLLTLLDFFQNRLSDVGNMTHKIIDFIKLAYQNICGAFGFVWKTYFEKHPVRIIILVIVLSALIIIFRRPSLLTNPQLWGEDGRYFYADAYHKGIMSLNATYANLQQLFLRLVGLFATILDIRFVPLFFSLVSTSALILPLVILWSDEKILFGVTKRRYLVIVSFLYLMMYPHWETYGNLANTGWYLAIAAALVLCRPVASSRKWLWADIPLLVISGLTGPYSIVMLLPAIYMYLKTKNKGVLLKLGIVMVCAFIQLTTLATHPNPTNEGIRSQVNTVTEQYEDPVAITGMRFIAIPLLSEKVISENVARSDQVLALGALTILMMTVALIRAPLTVKAFLMFCFGLYAVSLFRSFGSPLADYWFALVTTNLGARYFVIPLFGWIVALVYIMQQPKMGYYNFIAKTLIFLFLVTTTLSYRFSPVENKQYKTHAHVFNHIVEPGQKYCIPENPTGWDMCLKKH